MPTNNEDFAKSAYAQYCILFSHYSSLIFKSRISIISLALIMLIVSFGISLNIKSDTITTEILSPELKPIVSCLLPYLAAVVIVFLFNIQNAYVKRALEVVQAARKIENEYQIPLFFSNFEIIPQRILFMIYFFFCLLFVGVFLFMIIYQNPIWLVVAIPLTLIVLFLFYWMATDLTQRTKKVLGKIS